MEHLIREIGQIEKVKHYGKVSKIAGLLVECVGLEKFMSIGSRCKIYPRNGVPIVCEVIGFEADRALMMPFTTLEGVGVGSKVELADSESVIHPCDEWLGRVVNALGQPIDDKGALPQGLESCNLKASPPPANRRKRVGKKIDLGVRVLNTFTSCCEGQRMGIFAGSGVGKSMTMSMIARYSDADVNVIGLIGERGREVQEFIQEYLGEEGLKRSVVIVATSDESALMRKYAAYVTMAVCEYFRDRNKKVLCMMDSVTRFAMAQREIGLSAGEPPTSKGYTPTVFAELPKLLERAGPGVGEGNITGLFSVLVDGGDHDEPVADAVRGILDGHIVLERKIAERGRYPAVNVLKSVSRMLPHCNTEDENQIVTRARRILSTYEDMAEMIRLGAYKKGSDAEVDEAIRLNPALEAFLSQKPTENTKLAQGYEMLKGILEATPAE